jgi:hypothetical protein
MTLLLLCGACDMRVTFGNLENLPRNVIPANAGLSTDERLVIQSLAFQCLGALDPSFRWDDELKARLFEVPLCERCIGTGDYTLASGTRPGG